eukprot:646135-Pyramimonas_sp.AAC.1
MRRPKWSRLLVPLLWAATGDNDDEPSLQWLLQVLKRYGGTFEAVGERINAESLRRGFHALRGAFRQLGMLDAPGLRR